MKKLIKSYLIVIVAILSISFTLLAYLSYSEKLVVSRSINISDFTTCNKSIVPNEEDYDNCGKIFTKDVNSLFVCGYIDSMKANIAGISILLLRNESEVPVYVSPVSLRFDKGNFCHEILIPGNNNVGHYIVNVYYFRKIIASSEFEIK